MMSLRNYIRKRFELFLLNFWLFLHHKNAYLIEITNNYCETRLKILFNYFTPKYYGCMASTAMLEATEVIYEWLILKNLGKEYVVFTKETHIKYLRPVKKTLYAHFVLNPFLIFNIKESVEHWQEQVFSFWISLQDEKGKIYAQIEKSVYIARKDFYKIRQAHANYAENI